MVDRLAVNVPGLRQYATDAFGDLPQKEIEKLLQVGDPLTVFYRYVNSLDDMVSPLQYKELMRVMNRAIEDTAYQNIRPSLWALREGLETDLNIFVILALS